MPVPVGQASTFDPRCDSSGVAVDLVLHERFSGSRRVAVRADGALHVATVEVSQWRCKMLSMSPATASRPCPRCGATESIRVVYGYPTAETFEAAERGEVSLGGCVIGEESPDFMCRRCEQPLPWVAPRDD